MAGIKVLRVGDWAEAHVILDGADRDIPKAIAVAMKKEGAVLAKAVKEKIRTGPFAPKKGGGRNSAGRFVKGGGKPLNGATGALKGAVTSIADADSVFIGIARGAPGHGGKVYDLAAVHEFGEVIIIRMTDKMRRYLFGVMFKGEQRKPGPPGSTGIIVVKIPARPFIRTTFAEQAPLIPGRFQERLAKALGGKVGKP